MDISTAGALTRYNYQAAVQSGTQDTAVLQALQGAFSGLASGGAMGVQGAALGSLAGAIGDLSAAGGGTPPSGNALAAAFATAGGMDTGGASILFASSSVQAGGMNAGMGMGATLALAAYNNRQAGIPSGTAQNSAAQTVAAATSDPTQPDNVKAALQAAQTAMTNTTLNFLA